MNRVIEFEFSRKSVAHAQREFKAFSEELMRKVKELMEALVSIGIQVAKATIVSADAIDTGELLDSIGGYYSEKEHVGVVYAGAPYAIYVEYGTGVIGSLRPHPDISGFPPPPSIYTKYDTNGHGDYGWYYRSDRDGKLHWTRGQTSVAFMYTSYRDVERKMAEIAHQIFGR